MMALTDLLTPEDMATYLSVREWRMRGTPGDPAEIAAAMDAAMEADISEMPWDEQWDGRVSREAWIQSTALMATGRAGRKFHARHERTQRFRQHRISLPDCGPAEIEILAKARADLEKMWEQWRAMHREAIWLLTDYGDYDLMEYGDIREFDTGSITPEWVNYRRGRVRNTIERNLARRKTPPKEAPPDEEQGLRRVK